MAEETIDLSYLSRQIKQTHVEVRSMRDDMTVMMEILRRQDHRMAAVETRLGSLETLVQSIGTQLTDMHAYNRRTEQRVHDLEER